jgi:CRP/FNR family cyclic AMP-dependent transcriptional regulator
LEARFTMKTPCATLFEKVPIFAGLTEAAILTLADSAKTHAFDAGQLLVKEGVMGNQMFIIETGAVDIIKHLNEPHETILATLGPRNFFGEGCIIESAPRSASARAAEPTAVYELTAADLYHLFKKLPEDYAVVILNVARDISRRLRALDEVFAARCH